MTKEVRDDGLGRRLAGTRLRQGLSQAAAARLAGIAPAYLSRIETGKAQPTFRTLQRVARALRVPVERLLADVPRPGAPPRPPCPVTASGECLLDLIRLDQAGRAEAYTPAQVRLLRRLAARVRRLGPAEVRAIEIALQESPGEGDARAAAPAAAQMIGGVVVREAAGRKSAIAPTSGPAGGKR
jgi:transcriptional regulator with XRE-family HTH domain